MPLSSYETLDLDSKLYGSETVVVLSGLSAAVTRARHSACFCRPAVSSPVRSVLSGAPEVASSGVSPGHLGIAAFEVPWWGRRYLPRRGDSGSEERLFPVR